MLSSPENPMVISAKQKISKYSKDDWKTMSSEATHLTQMLGELVLYNVPVESKIAESAVDDLIEHFHKWFFPINKFYLSTLAIVCISDYRYSKFFDQFYPGLAKYLHELVSVYIDKVPD